MPATATALTPITTPINIPEILRNIPNRVEKGLSFLENHRPGYNDELTGEPLDISCNSNCLWGDLEGGYDAPAVSYYKALAEKEGANFTDLGFYSELVDELGLDHPSVQEEYRLLSYEFNTRLALA